ncbi:MAG: hypothetical protein IJL85_01955 [Erysipelotrichaceae bacterium]|nr:hypothetical protein [Erysipelotrichaceae bacterium]
MNQRQIAFNILYKTISDESYSNLLMRKELNQLEPIQRAFVTNLVNGVLRKYELLEYQYKKEINEKTSLSNRIILNMALFERFYLKEKDYVVNNEYVELAENRYDKSFINAILHKINAFEQSVGNVDSCLPEWIYRLLKAQYDDETFDKIIQMYQSIPTIYYRLNKLRCSYEDLKHLDIKVINEDSFSSENNLLKTKEYEKGFFYIQDLNSASLYKHLQLQKKDSLLDVCSAPGSKLFNCLDVIKPENGYANDVNGNRVDLIKKMAKKLGYEGIHYLNQDGRELKNVLDKKFDKILLDAPCSGLGVIGRKPDLKFHIKPESLDELQILQKELLNSMDPLLKQGGILLYSTCTLNKKENEKQISLFLQENPQYHLLEEEILINSSGDAFYYATIKKE